MKITPSLFEAFLKCPTKCWLRSNSETPSGNTYAEWVQSQDESFRTTEKERLLAGTPPGESARSPAAENLKTAKWQFAVDIPVRSEFGSSRGDKVKTSPSENSQGILTSAATIETCLHAVERIPSAGGGHP